MEWSCWIVWWLCFYLFEEPPCYFPQRLHQFTFLLAVHEGFFFSISLPTLLLSYLSDDRHSDRCKVICHCGFDLQLPDNYWCWASFHVPVCVFGKCLFRSPAEFLNWVFWFFFFLILSCMRFCISKHWPLIENIIYKYLLAFIRLSFCFIDGSVHCAKDILVMRFHLFTFALTEERYPHPHSTNIAKTNLKEWTACFLLGVLWFQVLISIQFSSVTQLCLTLYDHIHCCQGPAPVDPGNLKQGRRRRTGHNSFN